MEFEFENKQSVNVKVLPSDVESAVRQFICTCHPEFATNWLIDASEKPETVLMHMTKGDVGNGEKELLSQMQSMCEESLSPDVLAQWENVKEGLELSREALKE